MSPVRIIRDEAGIAKLGNLIGAMKLPVTVSITQGASRSQAQNRLLFRWFLDISRQLGDTTPSEVRAQCKVDFGVGIMSEDDGFRESWAMTFGVLPREARLKAVERLEPPVTSLMNVKQMTRMLDTMHQYWTSLGVRLTDPEAMRYEEEFRG